MISLFSVSESTTHTITETVSRRAANHGSSSSSSLFPGEGIRLGRNPIGQRQRDWQAYSRCLLGQTNNVVDDVVDDIVDVVDDVVVDLLDDSSSSWGGFMSYLDDYADTFDPIQTRPQLPPTLENKIHTDRMKELINQPGFKGVKESVDGASNTVGELTDKFKKLIDQPKFRGASNVPNLARSASQTAADTLTRMGHDSTQMIGELGERCTRSGCITTSPPATPLSRASSDVIGPALILAAAAKEGYDDYQENGDVTRSAMITGVSVARSALSTLAATALCGPGAPVCTIGVTIGTSLMTPSSGRIVESDIFKWWE
jgi:hypothetical protein